MGKLLKHLVICIALLVSGQSAIYGQVYPVNISPMQLAPTSIYFDDFYSLIQPKIKVLLNLNDLTVDQRDIYLKIKLTGPGLTIITTPGQKPLQPTVIFSGSQLDLTGVDLAEFFDLNKLSFSGITRQQIEINSRLPEGSYNLCFTVLDYSSNTPLSNETCLPLQLALSDPPTIINPLSSSVITELNPTNFLFNWMITNSNSLIDITNVNYQINLYEVTSSTNQPQNAIINNQALLVWQSPLLNQFVYNYGITDPPLEIGKKYVFNVQAIENYPRTQIKNNGYSAPSWFYYGYPEGGTIEIIKPDDNYQFKLSDPGQFNWKKPSNAIPNQLLSYEVKIVKVDSTQTNEEALNENSYFDQQTISPTVNATVGYVMENEKLNSLEKMQKYAWQVTGKTGNQITAQSNINGFYGPPYLDGFYAANFYIEIVHLQEFDTITGLITGRGKTKLRNGPNEYVEFNFSNVYLSSAGNNLWVMTSGNIKDEIIYTPYTILPNLIESNGPITFQPDSIHLTKDDLKLGGKMYWQLPLIKQASMPSIFESEFTFLNLSSGSFLLASENPVPMDENENVLLLEPYGFEMQFEYTSELFVYQGKYTAKLDGFIQLPSKVKDVNGTTLLMPITDQEDIHYMIENGQSPSPERIDFLANADFGLRGKNYIIDLSESLSPGDFSQDSTWKGVYFQTADLMIPQEGENSGQLSSNEELTVELVNSYNDSIVCFIDYTGLNLRSEFVFETTDQLYFNTFPSTETKLTVEIVENEFYNGHLKGGIYIPFVSEDSVFEYTVPLTNFGFQIGNIDESLIGLEFTHNANGGEALKVNMTVTRAVFKNKELIEFDLNANWPEFDVSLTNLQNLSVWGNGNIGFNIPNGAATLNNQAVAKSGDYEMVIDYVGCGRDQNLYAFGVSAKMNMAENISGTGGAPVVNAYSTYLNPRLSGTFLGSMGDMSNALPGYNQGGASDSTLSATTNSHLNNLSHSIIDFADSMGVDLSDTARTSEELIADDSYIKITDILNLIEFFIPYIDSTKQYKAQDYVTVGRQIIESDTYKGLTSKNPKEYLQDVMLEAVDGIIDRVNAPIVNVTNKLNNGIEDFMTEKVKNPISNTIDTIIGKVFTEIESYTLSSIEDSIVKNTIKSIILNTKNEIRDEIVLNINGSIDTNITMPITNFIKGALSDQITGFIEDQIRYIGEEFIYNGVNANINLNNIIDNADTLFNGLKDTLVYAFKQSGNVESLLTTGKSLVTDAFDNMDWNEVKNKILEYAVQQGVNVLLLNGLNEVLGNFDSGVLDGLMNNVSFDFSNLGEKIEEGDISGIVSFDPTNIKIETTACNIEGQLKHTEDDPQYGDHWRAYVAVKFKKPEKLQGIGIEALFITGKTTFSAPSNMPVAGAPVIIDSSMYSYWFASLAVTGLSIPLSPIPLEMYGIDGFAYHHMQRATPQSFPLPCRENKLGLGIGFIFTDVASSGKLLKLDLQLEVVINTGAWSMEMATIADVAHRKNDANGYSNPLATATGIMGYYSNIKTFKGQIDVVFHTQPLLCAGGTIKFNFDGLNNTWEISAGTQAQPIYAKLLCKDWLSITTFIEAENAGLKAGMNLNIDIAARSPWLDFGNVEVRGTAAFYLILDTYVDVQFQPDFRLNEAYVYLSMGASVGVDYKLSEDGDIHTFTIAGIALAGYGHYRAAPEGTLTGGLEGTVTVLGISCGLDINVNYDFGNQSDNS